MGKPWPKDSPRRLAQAERMRANNADENFTARRIAGVSASEKHKDHLRRLIAKNRATPEQVRQAARRPDVKAKKRAASIKMQDKRRGAPIPEGYESEYKKLRKVWGMPEALRMIRLQRGKDLRALCH